MINFFRILFKLNKVDELNKEIEKLKYQADINFKRIDLLEQDLSDYESVVLELRVTKLYVQDDESICEILDAAKKIDDDKKLREIKEARFSQMESNSIMHNQSLLYGNMSELQRCGNRQQYMSELQRHAYDNCFTSSPISRFFGSILQ